MAREYAPLMDAGRNAVIYREIGDLHWQVYTDVGSPNIAAVIAKSLNDALTPLPSHDLCTGCPHQRHQHYRDPDPRADTPDTSSACQADGCGCGAFVP